MVDVLTEVVLIDAWHGVSTSAVVVDGFVSGVVDLQTVALDDVFTVQVPLVVWVAFGFGVCEDAGHALDVVGRRSVGMVDVSIEMGPIDVHSDVSINVAVVDGFDVDFAVKG
ncbi:MAG: hypothetical protein CL920_32305 [Deltaproteobacteria bacterium]|nr:hypothetical protein [Deltaproteobacteria bacterium]MBU53402.1 hypothetical protein [Deltaproteobacteria bacterium]